MTKSRKLFVLSVVLNVFLAGALASTAIWITKARAPGYSLEAAGGRLSDPDRKDFRAALREVRRDSRQAIVEGQQARRDAAALLRQPVLDTAALAATLERARKADMAVRARLEQRIVDFAAASSPEARDLLAEGLVRRADRQSARAARKSP